MASDEVTMALPGRLYGVTMGLAGSMFKVQSFGKLKVLMETGAKWNKSA
jgi:hypothetical protein